MKRKPLTVTEYQVSEVIKSARVMDNAQGQGEAPYDQLKEEMDEGLVANPLNHEVVLRKVLGLFDLKDLKSCRGVNSFWNRISIPFLKRECVYISFNNDNYWTNKKNRSIEDMAEFINCVKASSNFPFVRLDIGTSVVQKPEDEAVLLGFFEIISPTVTDMTVRDEWGQNLFNTENIPDGLTFPLLESFTLHIIQSVKSKEDIAPTFQFIRKIFANSPVLDRLLVVDHNGVDGSVITYFLESITDAKYFRFSNLEIHGQIEDEHLIYLSEMGLQLKKLNLDFWGSMIKKEYLKMFLESQARSLQELKIADFAMSSTFTVEFPCLKNLKCLSIKGSVLGRICVSFPSVSYVKQFPVLKRLAFSNTMDEWDEFLKFGIQPVNTVQELKLPGDFADEVSLQHAARIFPNLKLLEVGANLHMLNVVYDTMPNVEELILNTKYIDSVDDIITGLNIIECQEIRSFTEQMFRSLESDFKKIQTTKPVSCLQRLKILRLKCKRQTDPVELTDVSCRLVLLKMKSLQCVDFWGRCPPTNRVSKSVLMEMKKRFLILC